MSTNGNLLAWVRETHRVPGKRRAGLVGVVAPAQTAHRVFRASTERGGSASSIHVGHSGMAQRLPSKPYRQRGSTPQLEKTRRRCGRNRYCSTGDICSKVVGIGRRLCEGFKIRLSAWPEHWPKTSESSRRSGPASMKPLVEKQILSDPGKKYRYGFRRKTRSNFSSATLLTYQRRFHRHHNKLPVTLKPCTRRIQGGRIGPESTTVGRTSHSSRAAPGVRRPGTDCVLNSWSSRTLGPRHRGSWSARPRHSDWCRHR